MIGLSGTCSLPSLNVTGAPPAGSETPLYADNIAFPPQVKIFRMIETFYGNISGRIGQTRLNLNCGSAAKGFWLRPCDSNLEVFQDFDFFLRKRLAFLKSLQKKRPGLTGVSFFHVGDHIGAVEPVGVLQIRLRILS